MSPRINLRVDVFTCQRSVADCHHRALVGAAYRALVGASPVTLHVREFPNWASGDYFLARDKVALRRLRSVKIYCCSCNGGNCLHVRVFERTNYC